MAGMITGGTVADEFEAEELDPDFVGLLERMTEPLVRQEFMLKTMLAEAEFLRVDIVGSIYDSAKDPKGDLARSYEVQLLDQGDDSISVGVFSDLVYAEIQDIGGDIEPKKKYLAIPFKGSKSIIGVRWPRDFGKDELQFVKSSKKMGTAYLFQGNRLMFILKDKVKMPGLRYLDKARTLWESNLDKNLASAVGLSFSDAGFK